MTQHVILAIYTRDPQGLVTFRGTEEWPGVAEFLESAYSPGDTPREPVKEEMTGWPDATVHWLIGTSAAGDTGYAIRRRVPATY